MMDAFVVDVLLVPHEVLACEVELGGVHRFGEEVMDRVEGVWRACEMCAEYDGVAMVDFVELGEEGLHRRLGVVVLRE